MNIPRLINDEIINKDNNIYSKKKFGDKNKKNILPFLKIDIEKNFGFPNLSRRLEKAKKLINSQTDKLLEEGFLGNNEDIQKYYSKYVPKNFKKMMSIKHKKYNNFLIKDSYNEPLKSTKTKEFNLTSSRKNKIFEQIAKSTKRKYNYKNINIKIRNKNYFNKLFLDNSTNKTNQINSSNSNNSRNIYSKNKSFNNIFDKNDSDLINKKFGKTFYLYKKKYKNNKYTNIKNVKNRPISLKNFMTLRNILNDTSQNINDINSEIKKYIKRNNSLNIINSNTTTNKNKNNNLFFQEEEPKLIDILAPSKKKKEEKDLKIIKKDEGINSKNILMRRSTANLITFGKSFMNFDDIRFYKERKRIMDGYPQLEKDAHLNENEHMKNVDEINTIKLQLKKMNRNIKKIKDMSYMNKFIFNKLSNQIDESKKY